MVGRNAPRVLCCGVSPIHPKVRAQSNLCWSLSHLQACQQHMLGGIRVCPMLTVAGLTQKGRVQLYDTVARVQLPSLAA